MTECETIIVPIQIRPGVVVQVKMPVDLKKDEAERVARVVIAMACSNGESKKG